MSSSAEEREVTISQTEVTVTQTKVSGNKDDLQEVLVNDISKVSKGVVKSLEGFRAFILRGNVVDLAIGIVIGAAFTAVVNALVGDIITPLIPVSKSSSLSTWDILIPHTYIDIHIGAFINAIISFLIIAAVLYFFVVQPVNSLMKIYHGKETATPTTRDCPYCYQAVNIKATRCPYCTSLLLDSETVEDKQQPVLILPEALEALSDKLADRLAKKASAIAEQSNEAAISSSTTSIDRA